MNPKLLTILTLAQTSAALGLLCSAIARAQMPDLLPQYWQETITATDGSHQRCLVFRTVPGVAYTVESSNDLTSWTVEHSLYGLGHDFATPMLQLAAPPPPPEGGTPGPPQGLDVVDRLVSLRLQPASGLEGGTVVSWPSLTDGGALVCWIPESMAPEWQDVPLYAERFGEWYFFVSHPVLPATPPEENPELTGDDAAMLAALRASVPSMNEHVAESVIRTRNTPPPAQPAPNFKKFWRIKADWGIDSDLDGSPDALEFANTAATGGSGSLRADAFNGDTNGNKILDGEELDLDQDGQPDALDAVPTDPTYSRPIQPLPRYALFHLLNASPEPWYSAPLQISDRGTVLYANGTWMAGVWTPLAEEGEGIRHATARGINDHDQILGLGEADGLPGWNVGTAEEGHPISLCYWPAPTAPPAPISADRDGTTVYPVPNESLTANILAPGPILSEGGQFPAGSVKVINGALVPVGFSKWQLPAASQPAGEALCAEFTYIQSPNITWGPDESDWSHGVLRLPAPLPLLPFLPLNVAVEPGGMVLATSRDPSGRGRAWYDGMWRDDSVYAQAIDVADDGTAIGHPQSISHAPVLFNGKWERISGAVPGVPLDWSVSLTNLIDTTKGGWILASSATSSTAAPYNAVMLPIIVEGVDPDFTPDPPPAGTPPAPPPQFFAGGVDRISMTAAGGAGKTQRTQIMAPNGGTNPVRILAPLNETSTLRLVGDSVVRFPATALSQSDQVIQVSGLGTDTESTEPEVTLGNAITAANTPIGIYAMKKRTVKVAVHEVIGRDSQGNPLEPTFPSDDEELMEEGLNKIYGRQTNTFFDVTIYREDGPNHLGIDFDNVGSVSYDGNLDLTVGGPELAAATPNAKATGSPPTANIDVWVVGGIALRNATGDRIFGRGFGAEYAPTVIIDGDLMGLSMSGSEAEDLFCHVLAHEIGHVMMGSGHADTGDCHAPLFWHATPSSVKRPSSDPRDRARLMHSGKMSSMFKLGKQLIYKEWVLIEAWLRNEEIHQRL